MKRTAAILLVLAALLSACRTAPASPAGPAAQKVAPTNTQKLTSARAPTATTKSTKIPPTEVPAKASRCIPAGQAQIEAIRAGVQGVDPANNIERVYAVKSGDFESVYMVAASITGTGLNPGENVGVWAIGGEPEKISLTLSVDGFAKSFSDWPDAATTKAAITQNADGVAEAKQCVADSY